MSFADQRKFATYIIELDEDLKQNPDETDDRLHDIQSWALDLARTHIDGDLEKRIRENFQNQKETE